VEVAQITIELLPDPLMYHIYLPPCYDEQTDRRYPVLYLVHGMNADDSQWVFMGVPGVLNRLVRTGELPPFIVVMPRDRIWAEPTVDNFGQAVVQDLLPWVDAHYRTLPQREYRLIGGLSWGGAWALHLGFSHPELFSAVGMHSSIVFGTDVLPLMGSLLDFPPGLTPRIYMDIGVQDRPDTLDEISWVEGLLAKKDIPHEWHLYQGKHNDTYWRSHVEEYLRWYSQSWSTDPALSYP
jgi:enterochelin esterase-like enzyme